MSIRPFLTVLGAASIATIAALSSAQAMSLAAPIAAPAVQGAASDEGVASSSSLIQDVYYHPRMRRHPAHGYCFYHPRHCHR